MGIWKTKIQQRFIPVGYVKIADGGHLMRKYVVMEQATPVPIIAVGMIGVEIGRASHDLRS